MIAPKVFVSHASEDKARFVLGFAHRLRENGVDAWLDQWEMKPGDSLVDKIFEQGLKEAQAVIIVLSSTSVQKPWVREELNASVVNRINKGTKLIPVVIDDCEVPECLRSMVWQKIENIDDYDSGMQRILSAILDISDKPGIGKPPARFTGPEPTLLGLTRVDELVLREIARLQIEENEALVMFDRMRAEPLLIELPEQDLIDSIEILGQQCLITISRVFGAPVSHVVLTDYGFQQYAEAYIVDYQQTVDRVAALLVNENISNNEALAARVGKPIPAVNFILNLLESNGHIKKSNEIGGLVHVWHIAPSLKRVLQ